jgi:hypothetical protein
MNEETKVTRGNAEIVIQEHRITVMVSLESGATATTTISRETGKVETQG